MGGPRPCAFPRCHEGVLIMDPYTLAGRFALFAFAIAAAHLYHHLAM